MQKLPDDTKKLISDAIKSDSAPISCKDAKKKKGKKGVAKAAAVNAHAAGSLAGVELFVNTLNSGPMAAIAVVDAWGYDGDHDLRGNDLRFLMGFDFSLVTNQKFVLHCVFHLVWLGEKYFLV
jgi:hypothetical protein